MSVTYDRAGVDDFADFDHNDVTLTADEFRERHNDMRERCPVAHSREHGGFDVVTRYADVRSVLMAPETFSSADGVFIPQSKVPRVAAMEFDDPEHTMWRRLLSPPLTVPAVREFESTLVAITDQLIDGFASRGEADLVPELAQALPAIVVGSIVGLSHDEALVSRDLAAQLYAAIGSEHFDDRMDDFTAFTEAQLEERRRHPRGDFLTQVASGSVDGVPVDTAGAASLMIATIVGGHHSTSSGIGALLRDVLSGEELRRAVVEDPKTLARAVDESLRLNTPLQYFARTATQETEVAGTPVGKGDKVLVDLAAANRDPREFDDPEAFRLDRRRNAHVAFGAGSHVCLGQHLARTEMRVAVSRLLARLPDVHLTAEAPETVVAGKLVTTVTLPVHFTPVG